MKLPTAVLALLVYSLVFAQPNDSLGYRVMTKDGKDSAYVVNQEQVVDTFFGVAVPDPFRWLENLNSEATKKWLENQQTLTRKTKRKFYGSFNTVYDKISKDGIIEFETWFKRGPYYFRYMYISREGAPALFYARKPTDEPTLVYNPYQFNSKDVLSIDDFTVSPDGKYLILSLSHSGTDWQEIRVKELKKTKLLPDKIQWAKFSNVVWWDSGFFYSRFAQPEQHEIHTASNKGQRLCYHKLGDEQEKDKTIYHIPDAANEIFQFDLIADSNYLLIYTTAKIKGDWSNVICYIDLREGIYGQMKMLLANKVAAKVSYEIIGCQNGKFIVLTDDGAPRSKVLQIDKDSFNRATELIPEFKETLTSLYQVGNRLLGIYFHEGYYTGVVFDSSGTPLKTIQFEAGVRVRDFEFRSDSIIHFIKYSFYYPTVDMEINLKTNESSFTASTYVHYDADHFTTKVVNYKSKDGTLIPMYLTYKKGIKLNKNNPTLLYGYGGFGIPLTPFYSFSNIVFFENGGILATPLIRGGGDYGKQWHEEGMHLKKQNTFDDFIAAAEFLIDSGYTNPEKLVIEGGSHGGLLVGAVLTQRPELFKLAIAKMGVFDMLRVYLFTAARFLAGEFGNPSNPEDFQNLLSYSPYHQVKDSVNYPATLLFTAENDDRVPPLHSYKFLAQLQKKTGNKKPYILYFEDAAGHDGGQTINKNADQEAFKLSFMFDVLGLPLRTDF